MTIIRSLLLFALAALAEIGGAWLVWQGWREHRGLGWNAAGVLALGIYGFVATFQPDPHFGRILAAYGGIFVVGSLALGRDRRQVPPRSVGLPRGWNLSARRRRDHVRAPSLIPSGSTQRVRDRLHETDHAGTRHDAGQPKSGAAK